MLFDLVSPKYQTSPCVAPQTRVCVLGSSVNMQTSQKYPVCSYTQLACRKTAHNQQNNGDGEKHHYYIHPSHFIENEDLNKIHRQCSLQIIIPMLYPVIR